MEKLGMTTTYEDLENLSVPQALRRSVRMVPEKVCVSFKDRTMTYRELDEQSNALASSLQNMGIEKGDRVAIYLSTCPELYVAFYALQKIGVITAWVNAAYRTHELTFILNNSSAKAVFVQKGKDDSDNLALLQNLRGSLPHLCYIISLGGGHGDGVVGFEDLLSAGRDKKYSEPAIDIHQDLSMLIYTSGTTGIPKGSMVTQHQVVRGGYSHVRGVEATADDIFLGILPLTHSYGCGTTLIQPILIQASVILLEAFAPEEAFKAIEAGKAT
ncbi:MAG TPA: hypothetical protein DCR97_09140, partial [Deltaproteobacteria bacterium]|nr:hypothetical protein [Deltaproteobacteria bacterium]